MPDRHFRGYLVGMDSNEQIFASGVSSSGDTWKLSWEGDELKGITWLGITTPDGHTHKGGYGEFSLASGSAVCLYSGSADHVPNGAVLRVSSEATALEASTSDGVAQVLDLVEHPAHQGASVAALIYPRGTKITSVLLVDEAGQRTVQITRPQV